MLNKIKISYFKKKAKIERNTKAKVDSWHIINFHTITRIFRVIHF